MYLIRKKLNKTRYFILTKLLSIDEDFIILRKVLVRPTPIDQVLPRKPKHNRKKVIKSKKKHPKRQIASKPIGYLSMYSGLNLDNGLNPLKISTADPFDFFNATHYGKVQEITEAQETSR